MTFRENRVGYCTTAIYITYLLRKIGPRGLLTRFLKLVAEITDVPVCLMQGRSRDRRTASARRTAVLAWRALERRTGEIAAALAIGAPAATHLARRNCSKDDEARRNADIVIARCRFPNDGIAGSNK